MSLIPTLIAAADGYTAPGPSDFELPPVFADVTKPMLQLVLAGVLVFVFLRAASARRAMVPGKMQFLGEVSYDFVRNTLGRDVIGSKDFLRFVPLLVSLFFFILFNNVFAAIPFIQFPTMSRIAVPIVLAMVVWFVYNGAGVAKFGFLRYLKNQTVPPGVPTWLLPLMIPLEFFSNIIVRPITLLLRLWANMFAGHLLLILFALGGTYLLTEASGLFAKAGGVMAIVMFVLISFLELLVQFLQAFIFTILAALYISSSLAEEH